MTDQKTLVPMQPTAFATEDDFQKLLADFPALLAGEQIDGLAPRRWVLVSREKSIPDEEDGGGRWSLDHLFIDQDGIPTLVEVKRQSDTRLRREVVGQMLDYVANAVAYWPVEELRAEFEKRCETEKHDPDEELRTTLGLDGDPDAFWQRVKTNLQAGRVRMLFVADRIPSELRRIVEFLNEQMDPAEVLALELRQYAGQGLKTIVPMLFGQTQEAQVRKSATRPGRQWDEPSIYAEIERRFGPEQVKVAREIGSWINTHADRVWFGRGVQSGSMCAVFRSGNQDLYPLNLWTYGKVEVAFQTMQKHPFDDPALRTELLHRLNEIEGVKLAPEAIALRPSIPLDILAKSDGLARLLNAMEWFKSQIRAV